MTNTTDKGKYTTPALEVGTKVLNTDDGEAQRRWTEYEVITQYGIEIWKVGGFILLDDARAAANV